MNTAIVLILCFATLAAAQPYANSYLYTFPTCGGEVKRITVWDSKCTNESTTGSRYYTCNGHQQVAYTSCSGNGCVLGTCDTAPLPQTCLPDNTKRDCDDTILPSPTGWYTQTFFTGLSCTGTLHQVVMSSSNDCQVNLFANTSVYYTCTPAAIMEFICLDRTCGKSGGICTSSEITISCSNVGGVSEGSVAYSCGTGPLPANWTNTYATTGSVTTAQSSTQPPTSQPSSSPSSSTVPSSTQQTETQSSSQQTHTQITLEFTIPTTAPATQPSTNPTQFGVTTGELIQEVETGASTTVQFCLLLIAACLTIAWSSL